MRQFVIFTRGIRLCDPDVAGTFVFLIHRVSYWNFLPLTTTVPVFSIDATRIYVSVVRRTRRKRARIRKDMLQSPRPFRFACPVSTNPKRGRVTCSRDNRTVKRAFLTELPVLAAVDTNMKRMKMHALVLLSICLSVDDKIFIRIAIQRAPYTRQLSILVVKSKVPFIARMIFQKFKSHRLWLKLRWKSEEDTVQDSSFWWYAFISIFCRARHIIFYSSLIDLWSLQYH